MTTTQADHAATLDWIRFDPRSLVLVMHATKRSGKTIHRINRGRKHATPAVLRAALVATNDYDNAETIEIAEGTLYDCPRCSGKGHLGRGRGWHAYGTCFRCRGAKIEWTPHTGEMP